MDGQESLTVSDLSELPPENQIRGKICDMLLAEINRWEKYNFKSNQEMMGWRLLILAATWPDAQPAHVDSWEAHLIHLLQRAGFSYSEIGFIFDRSKSSICEALRRPDTAETQQ